MHARMMAFVGLAAVLLTSAGTALGQGTHALWPGDWNNWNDPALWVTVGNAGNAPDTRYETPGYGAVAYEYRIGKFEVTARQYTAFLNAVAGVDTYGLYSPAMDVNIDAVGCNIVRSGSGTLLEPYTYNVAADWANRPVNRVNWGDAVRFANWLTNGQPTGLQGPGTTDTGSYVLNGAMTESALLAITRIAEEDRIAGQTYYFIPTEDEWYKAAYHKNDGATGDYWVWPTKSNDWPSNRLIDPDPGNNATVYQSGGYTVDSPYWRTEAGAHENTEGPYGTFDQGGNVWEWNEAIVEAWGESVYRGMRGCSSRNETNGMQAMVRNLKRPGSDSYNLGFRIVEVPEPASLALLALGGAGMLLRRPFGRGRWSS